MTAFRSENPKEARRQMLDFARLSIGRPQEIGPLNQHLPQQPIDRTNLNALTRSGPPADVPTGNAHAEGDFLFPPSSASSPFLISSFPDSSLPGDAKGWPTRTLTPDLPSSLPPLMLADFHMPDFIDRTWLWFATAFYLAGFVIGSIALLRERRHSRTLMFGVLFIGFALQTFGLYQRGLAVKGCPLGNNFEIFQFTAWSAISLYLVIGPAFRLSLLGYFTSLLAAVLTSASLAIPAWDATRRVGIFGGNPWIEFHAAIALFSYGVFALLALTSAMFLLQVFSLKKQRLRGLFSFLPSMRDLDHINLRLLGAGVVLLGSSLAVGSAYWVQDTATVNSAKLIITVALWTAYATVLGLRLKEVLISKRLAWTCIVLFAAALLSLQAVNASRPPLAAPTPVGVSR